MSFIFRARSTVVIFLSLCGQRYLNLENDLGTETTCTRVQKLFAAAPAAWLASCPGQKYLLGEIYIQLN